MNAEELQTSGTPPAAVTATAAASLGTADHTFQRGSDWSRDGSLPRLKVVSTFYSTLIVPRNAET